MPLTPDGYEPDDTEALFQEAKRLHLAFDGDANVGKGTVRRATLLTMAEMLATNQEQSLEGLYNGSFIETASGQDLDRRVNDYGLSRKEAQPATGVIEFYRDDEPKSRQLISRGTIVETAGDNPVPFETTEQATLGIIDGFEGGSLDNGWVGNTGQVSVVDGSASSDPSPNDGSYHLKLEPNSSASIHTTEHTVEAGVTVRQSIYAKTDTITGAMWFVDPDDATNHYRLRVDAVNNNLEFLRVDSGSKTTLSSTSVTIPTGEYLTAEIDTTVNEATVCTLYDASGSVVETVTDDSGNNVGDTTYTSGYIGINKGDSTDNSYVDTITTTATAATIEGTSGGEETNVGPRAIEVIPNGASNLQVVNPRPTGTPEYEDTTGEVLVVGTDRETDEELRDRALDSTAIGGAATVPAVEQALWGIDDVISVTAFENDTLNDNTGSGGLPEVSIELVVYGGTDEDVANTLFDTIAATERLYGGAHGTKTTYTVTSDLLNEDETMEWSRPSKTNVDLTLGLVVDETYVGDEEIKQILVEYIGGTDIDGATLPGTGIGEDVRIDAIRDRVVGPDTGVKGISNVSATPSTTTDSNGLTIIDIADAAVAETDATDGSLTLNITEL